MFKFLNKRKERKLREKIEKDESEAYAEDERLTLWKKFEETPLEEMGTLPIMGDVVWYRQSHNNNVNRYVVVGFHPGSEERYGKRIILKQYDKLMENLYVHECSFDGRTTSNICCRIEKRFEEFEEFDRSKAIKIPTGGPVPLIENESERLQQRVQYLTGEIGMVADLRTRFENAADDARRNELASQISRKLDNLFAESRRKAT